MMRQIYVIVILSAFLVSLPSPMASAEEGSASTRSETTADFKALQPPAPGADNTFSRDLANSLQRTKGTYLPEGAPLDVKQRATRQRQSEPISLEWDTRRVLGTLGLILVFGFLAFLLWRSGWMQSLMNARRTTRILDDDAEAAPYTASPEGNPTTAQILAAETPRQGLQIFMRSVLEWAARQGKVPLRRAMTGREIIRRLPPADPHKTRLRDLLRKAEPVLFGDDTITEEELRDLVERHASLLPPANVRVSEGRWS